jgi:glycosyltransferase involved in cell wall biosynthesis
MKVLHVNSTLGLRTGGGTAERTFQVSRQLAISGVSTTVLTLDIELDEERWQAISPATVIALPCLWKRFYLPQVAWKKIRQLVDEADVIHLMGHWGALNALVYIAARRANKPYVVCPAGALPLFGRSSILKRIYNRLIGHALIRNAAAWVAVTDAEFPQFEKYGVNSSAVQVIPNGVNREDFPAIDSSTFFQRYAIPGSPYILFLGRLNRIKGPDLLLESFLRVRKKFSSHHLVFAGPDDGMLADLQSRVASSDAGGFVHFVGYVSGEDKVRAYRNACLMVIPSRLEAMSIVALEAGICGTPVLLTDKCGFSQILTVDPRLEVPATIEGLSEGLSNLLPSPENLSAVGEKMQQFVESTFTWHAAANRYRQLYEGLAGRSPE